MYSTLAHSHSFNSNFVSVDRTQSQFFLTGKHDVDQGWIAEVRSNYNSTSPPEIVPRFIFEGFTLEDYQLILGDQTMINAVIDILVRECVYVIFCS